MNGSTSSAGKISRTDLESKFREVQTELTSKAEAARGQMVAVVGVVAFVVLLLTYLLGRKGGKKKSTIVEIRRL